MNFQVFFVNHFCSKLDISITSLQITKDGWVSSVNIGELRLIVPSTSYPSVYCSKYLKS